MQAIAGKAERSEEAVSVLEARDLLRDVVGEAAGIKRSGSAGAAGGADGARPANGVVARDDDTV